MTYVESVCCTHFTNLEKWNVKARERERDKKEKTKLLQLEFDVDFKEKPCMIFSVS